MRRSCDAQIPWRLIAPLIIVLVGAGCSTSGDRANARDDEGLPAPRFLSQISVPSVNDARQFLSFEPLLPEGLGEPSSVVMNDPEQVDREQVAIGMLFESTTLSTFWLKESPPAISQSDMGRLAGRCEESKDCEGETWSLVTLEDGSEALLIDSPPAGLVSLRWLAGGIELSLLGSLGSFSGDQAIAVAASLK